MIINTAEEMRNLTGSYYANNDFRKIENIVKSVEDDISDVIGHDMMAHLNRESEGKEGRIGIETDDEGRMMAGQQEITVDGDTVRIGGYSPYGLLLRVEGDTLYVSNARAVTALKTAVAYMAAMRFYRLNDISHENAGRKVKIDRENEARPFEWQLARDDRAHLDEYYRALNRLTGAIEEDPRFRLTAAWKRRSALIVGDADTLAWLTGIDASAWLYMRMVPFLAESQRFVEKAYGESFKADGFCQYEDPCSLNYAAQMATAMGAVALMGRRTSLQTMPYGLMKLFESDGGGNRQEAAALDRLDDYLKHLSKEQHYWLNEMKQLRDEAAGKEPATRLQMPDNDPRNKFMRV